MVSSVAGHVPDRLGCLDASKPGAARGKYGVPLGDSIYADLRRAHFPAFAAAYAGEAAIDLPDKLLAVLGAFLIYRGLPAQPARRSTLELDVGEACAYAFRSRKFFVKIAIGALCLLFSWLLVPLLLFAGYTVSVARSVRAGGTELKGWDHLGVKLNDGLLVMILVLIWTLPGIGLGLPAELASGEGAETGITRPAGTLGGAFGVLAALGGLWGLFVLVAQGAIWSQYLRGGFRAGLNLADVIRRVRFNLGLTMVVAALATVLAVIAFSGFVALLLGALLTLPYCSWVGAYLFGRYARMTDEAVEGPGNHLSLQPEV